MTKVTEALWRERYLRELFAFVTGAVNAIGDISKTEALDAIHVKFQEYMPARNSDMTLRK